MSRTAIGTRTTRADLIRVLRRYGVKFPASARRVDLYHLALQAMRDQPVPTCHSCGEPREDYNDPLCAACRERAEEEHAERVDVAVAIADAEDPVDDAEPEVDAAFREAVAAFEPAHGDESRPVDAAEPEEELEATTEIVAAQPAGLPMHSRWLQMTEMASALARSNLVPRALRGKAPDVLLVLLAAHDLGVPTTTALTKLYVIEGRLAMGAELMVALVQSRGHALWPEESTSERAVACGQRAGSPYVARVTWTIADARQAKLTDKDNWKHYPTAMLWARAVSQLCRMQFADILCGITYTPDELGAVTDPYGGAYIDAEEADERPLTDEQVADIRARIDALSEDDRAKVREQWDAARRGGGLVRLANATTAHLPIIEGLLRRFTPAPPDSAETLEALHAEVVEPCPDCGRADGEHHDGCASVARPDGPLAGSKLPRPVIDACPECGTTDEATHEAGCTLAPF